MFNTKKLTQTALIAGLYAAITLATFYISFGMVQYRVSEVLTILPVFTATAVPGLSIGCAVANLIGFFVGANPLGLIDAIVGTSATLIAAVCTYYIGKSKRKWIKLCFAPLPPVIFNAVIIGLELTYIFNGMDMSAFFVNAGLVFIGQAVICYGLGIPLMLALSNKNVAKHIFRKQNQI